MSPDPTHQSCCDDLLPGSAAESGCIFAIMVNGREFLEEMNPRLGRIGMMIGQGLGSIGIHVAHCGAPATVPVKLAKIVKIDSFARRQVGM
jgi:hypothetical protein